MFLGGSPSTAQKHYHPLLRRYFYKTYSIRYIQDVSEVSLKTRLERLESKGKRRLPKPYLLSSGT